jgi:hypothetical protein
MGGSKAGFLHILQPQNRDSTRANLANTQKWRCRVIYGLFRIVISASMGADFPRIPHESTLFSRACKPTPQGDRPLSSHCEGVCTPDPMVCALVRGSTGDVRRGWYGQKSLIFMHFHGVFLGSQHEIWSKQHNGKVRIFPSYGPDRNSLLKRLARDYPYRSYAFLLLSTCVP